MCLKAQGCGANNMEKPKISSGTACVLGAGRKAKYELCRLFGKFCLYRHQNLFVAGRILKENNWRIDGYFDKNGYRITT